MQVTQQQADIHTAHSMAMRTGLLTQITSDVADIPFL